MAPAVQSKAAGKMSGSVRDEEKDLPARGPCLPETRIGYVLILISLGMHVYTLQVSWL